MKTIFLNILLTFFLFSCSSVAITGRKQLNFVNDKDVLASSFQQYNEFIHSSTLSSNTQATRMVEEVGRNIANAVERYFRERGESRILDGYAWEFHLVKDNQANAFCMPGGKIVVYEGILPYTQDATGLAVVVGHEVAHAVARHSNERMSQQIAAALGGVAVDYALRNKSETARAIGESVYGLGAQYGVMLPYSRHHELEADHLGLIFMAMAGYDPSAAIPFWQRMGAGGGSVPEFLSTHPSDGTRVKKIQEWLPEALKYFEK